MKRTALLTALLTLPSADALTVSTPARIETKSHYCPITVYRDYNLQPVSYRAVLLRETTCTLDQIARVRKTSGLNLGARYQPIRPEVGAWEVRAAASTVPPDQLWTLYSWRWQWFDGSTWRMAATR